MIDLTPSRLKEYLEGIFKIYISINLKTSRCSKPQDAVKTKFTLKKKLYDLYFFLTNREYVITGNKYEILVKEA